MKQTMSIFRVLVNKSSEARWHSSPNDTGSAKYPYLKSLSTMPVFCFRINSYDWL